MNPLNSEWLKGYFDGSDHVLGGEYLSFPDLTGAIFFNQTQLPASLSGPVIHWLFNDLRNTERMNSPEDKLITVDFVSTVYVRASASNVGNQADFDVRKVAELLRFLLTSPVRAQLNQAGIHHLRCPRGPIPTDVPGWASRMLIVTGELQYKMTNY